MKILVVSDTHNSVMNVFEAIDKLKPDYTFHLGDMAADCECIQREFPNINFNAVMGNNDYFGFKRYNYQNELFVTIDKVKLFMCHGHTYGVKSGLSELKRIALLKGADIALFGHTHTKMCEYTDGIYLVNPGSARSTFALIETNNGKPDISLHSFYELEE